MRLRIFFVTPLVLTYLFFIRWADRFEPEPWGMLAISFIWGASIAVFLAMIFNGINEDVLKNSLERAQELAGGPTAAHAVTKRMLHEEWNVTVDQAIDMEALAQAKLMENKDFRRAYEAFAAKQKPVFQGD